MFGGWFGNVMGPLDHMLSHSSVEYSIGAALVVTRKMAASECEQRKQGRKSNADQGESKEWKVFSIFGGEC